MIIRKSVAIVASILLAVVPVSILYMTQVYPNGAGSDIDTSINVGSDTKVFWNGKDRTNWTTGAEPYAGLQFEIVPAINTSENFYPPMLSIASAVVNPETMLDGVVTPETKLALFWRVGNESYSYGRNGKQLARLAFNGLNDDELIELTPNGVIIQIKNTGTPRTLSITLKDDRGVETAQEFNFYPA